MSENDSMFLEELLGDISPGQQSEIYFPGEESIQDVIDRHNDSLDYDRPLIGSDDIDLAAKDELSDLAFGILTSIVREAIADDTAAEAEHRHLTVDAETAYWNRRIDEWEEESEWERARR